MTKNILTSKTLYINLVAAIIALVWGGSDVSVMSSIANTVPAWLPLVNVINRFFTNSGVTIN